MEKKIIIAGSGGQGIMFMGKLLAEACLLQGKNVTFLPAYGAEVRGGTANCAIVVSDEEIGSPFAETADILVAMNEPSLRRFRGRVRPGGIVLVNGSLVKDPGEAQSFPFTQLAIDLGSVKSANMVALGCFAKKTGIVGMDAVLSALGHSVKPAAVAVNSKAAEAGAAL